MTSANRYRRPEHSEIKHKNMRFLITDRPTDTNVERYVEVRLSYFCTKKNTTQFWLFIFI